jgi:transcriptional regulator with XRE-family HTH domain
MRIDPAELRRHRETSGMNRDEFARAAQITRSYLEKLEVGSRANPSPATVARIAAAAGCEIKDLVPA